MLRLARRAISNMKHDFREEYLDQELKNLTHYEILRVRPTSNKTEIRKAYLDAARKHHPDLGGTSSTEFSYITKAYQVLSDEHERAAYDDSLIDDTSYYKVGRIHIGWIFAASFGLFFYSIAKSYNIIEDWPTSYKVKKLGGSEDDTEGIKETKIEEDSLAWKKSVKIQKASNKVKSRDGRKGIFEENRDK